jgi:hypothetical protein
MIHMDDRQPWLAHQLCSALVCSSCIIGIAKVAQRYSQVHKAAKQSRDGGVRLLVLLVWLFNAKTMLAPPSVQHMQVKTAEKCVWGGGEQANCTMLTTCALHLRNNCI